jgi:hypothetical protein
MISISSAASAGTGSSHKSRIRMAISPDAIARSIAFAVGQPADVDVGKLCPPYSAELAPGFLVTANGDAAGLRRPSNQMNRRDA